MESDKTISRELEAMIYKNYTQKYKKKNNLFLMFWWPIWIYTENVKLCLSWMKWANFSVTQGIGGQCNLIVLYKKIILTKI